MNFTPLPNGISEGYCLVKTVEKKVNVKGVPYLDMILGDSDGEINAKLWDYRPEIHGRFESGSFIKVRGTVSIYNGQEQFRIERIRDVTPADDVEVENFVPSADYPGDQMLSMLYGYVDSVEDTGLREITKAIIDDNRERLLFWPAAYRLHHALRGGLLYHTLSILRLADFVCELYPSIDRDLLICGAALHDISKLSEFDVNSVGIVKSYSVQGELLGHLVMGAMEIEKKAQQLGTDKKSAMLLEHMVISHHGDPEFGAAVRPMFLEAEVLSELDKLDATVYEITSAVSAVEPGEFTQRMWALDNRKLFNHDRKAVKATANLDRNEKN